MIRSGGRRAAVVAAVVGLLAALTSGVVAGAVPVPSALASAASTVVAPLGDPAALSTPSTGLVSDVVRAAHPAAARTGSTERVPHLGGWALAALLLLLAACALAVGVRRATAPAPGSIRGAASGPRAPPALASC